MNVWRLTVKELKVLSRDVGGLIMLFIVPISFIIIFSYAMAGTFSGPESRPFQVPVANLDRGELGAKVVEGLDKSEWIRVENIDSEKGAIARVESGERSQAVVIPPDFTEKITAGREVRIPVYLAPAVPSQFTGPVIGALQGALIGTTMSEQIKAKISGSDAEIIARIDEMGKQFAREKGFPAEGWQSFITPEEIFERFVKNADFAGEFEFDEEKLLARIDKRQPPSIEREKFPSVYQQTISAYAVMFVFFILVTVGNSFLREKDEGTFRRLLAAPVRRVGILAGKLLPYLIVNFLQIVVMFLTGVILFGVDLGSSPEGIFAITLCLSLCACGLGILMATLFRTYNQLSSVGVLVVLSTSAIAGLMVPRFIMGEFMQQLGLFVPQTWAMEAYQDIMVRGRGLLEVLPNCGVLLLFATLFFSIALWRFRFE